MPKTESPAQGVDGAPLRLPLPLFLPRGVPPFDAGALPLSGLTMLLVEDSRFASDAIRLMCQRSGARLRRVETMAQARAHLKTYRPDVVIVDLGLPDGPGDRLIHELACARQGVVVLGTSGDPDGRKAALGAGAMGFFDKPIAGLAGFQRAVLRHLPDRFAGVARARPDMMVQGDPMALHDDLAHAADLMAKNPHPDVAQRRYLANFLCGLARATGDGDLADAARAMAREAGTLAPLRRIVQVRLARGCAF
jgi:DNA-binding NarL/FixJ family response regulator